MSGRDLYKYPGRASNLQKDSSASDDPQSYADFSHSTLGFTAEGVTFSLLGQLLHDAFEVAPPPFDEQGLQYDTPPDLDAENEEAFAILQQMLCYQIADVHLMAQRGQIHDPNAFFGIDSPTGHRWYNLHPSSYLECAVAPPITDGSRVQCSWGDLAILLWLGQIYE